jgi:hypothetical protein
MLASFCTYAVTLIESLCRGIGAAVAETDQEGWAVLKIIPGEIYIPVSKRKFFLLLKNLALLTLSL